MLAWLVSERTLTKFDGSHVRPRKHSDEDILTATRQCVLDHGAQVSTELIADAAGVSQATLFKRFGTKDNLLRLALCTQIAADWLDRLNQAQLQVRFAGRSKIRSRIGLPVSRTFAVFDHLESRSAQGLPKQEERAANANSTP